MALSLTSVNVYESAAAHGTGSFVTSAFTPANNSLLCVAVCGTCATQDTTVNGTVTCAGGGWTYTQRAIGESVFADNDFAIWFTAPVGTGASMTITVDCGAVDINRYYVHVFTFTGYDTGSPIGGIGSKSIQGAAEVPSTHTLNATPATTSYVLSVVSADGGGFVTGGTGWTAQFASSNSLSKTQSRTGSTSTTVLWDHLETELGVASIEIKEGAAGPTDHSGAATFGGAGSMSVQGTQMTPVILMGQIVM